MVVWIVSIHPPIFNSSTTSSKLLGTIPIQLVLLSPSFSTTFYNSGLLLFLIINSLISPKDNQQKRRTCWRVDFAVPADHKVKLKESKKRHKYLDLARELKKQWNMKIMVIPIVIGVLGTITKILIKELENLEIRERADTIQTTAMLKSTRILRRVLETWGDLLSFRFV